MNSDAEQLRALSIAHYVMAGITALFSCFPIIHVIVGLLVLFGAFPDKPGGDPFPHQLFGLLFVGMGSFFILMGWTLALCLVFVGRSLNERKRYQFCLVMASLCCIFAPLGTLLGVFTLIVLLRPSVHALFHQAEERSSSSANASIAEPSDDVLQAS